MNRIPPTNDASSVPTAPSIDTPPSLITETSLAPLSKPIAEVEVAPLPRSLVSASAETLLEATLTQSGILRDRMQSLHIQPRPFSFDEPNVTVYSTDKKSHGCPECSMITMMMAASHSAALDLHNLACTVTPVAPLLDASERFGVAFFAQTRENAGAAIRLRDTLDIVAAEMATRSLAYVPERPWIEFVHQMLSPVASPLDSCNLLPVEVFRIRFRGLEWAVVEGLLADALSSLPVLTERDQRSDVFTLTLSGQS